MDGFCRIETVVKDKTLSATFTLSRHKENGWTKTVSSALKLTPEEEKTLWKLYERIDRENPPGEG